MALVGTPALLALGTLGALIPAPPTVTEGRSCSWTRSARKIASMPAKME